MKYVLLVLFFYGSSAIAAEAIVKCDIEYSKNGKVINAIYEQTFKIPLVNGHSYYVSAPIKEGILNVSADDGHLKYFAVWLEKDNFTTYCAQSSAMPHEALCRYWEDYVAGIKLDITCVRVQ